jgi:predicted Zn-dependent peptidase
MKLDLRKALPIKHKTLSNGLEVYILTKHNAPLVTINLAYRVGSKDEEIEKTGLAHLFEHMMFEGSKNIPKGDFDKLCSMAGGTNNAYTTYDMTCYYMTLPSNQLELGLWMESDRMANFGISESALETQKNVVCEEISQTVDEQPYGKWRELLADLAFSKNCSYNWEVHGKKEHVESVTIEYVNSFFKSHYQPANAALVICGDVQFDKAIELVEKYFGSINSDYNISNRNYFLPEYMLGNAQGQFSSNVPLPGIFVAYHCPGFLDDSIYTAEILSNIAGVGRSSRIYKELVYNKQIASQAGVFVDKREYSSLLTFYVVANDKETTCDYLYDNLMEVIEGLKKEIKSREIKKSKTQLSTMVAYELQKTSGIADVAVNQLLFTKDTNKIYNVLDMYNKQTSASVVELANRIFKKENQIRIDAVMDNTVTS